MDHSVSAPYTEIGYGPNSHSRLLEPHPGHSHNSSTPMEPWLSRDSTITRACEMCRKKKIKCDRVAPQCGQCIRRHTTCIFNPSSRISRREKLKENQFSQINAGAAGLSVSNMISLDNHQQDREIDQMYSNLVLLQGDLSAAIMAEFPPVGVQQTTRPLPPLYEALPMVQFYFEKLNHIFPLFNQLSFMHLLDEEYVSEGRAHETSAAWCSINVVLCLAYRFRALTSDATGEDHEKGAEYLQKALSVAPDILLGGSDLLSVQCLLGIAEILQATSAPRSYSMFVAAAGRLAHHIGLHREVPSDSPLTGTDKEQRRRVFWIANIFDKDISVRSGVPPVLNCDDADILLPCHCEMFEYSNDRDLIGTLDMFGLRVRLSIIDNLIYQRLLSTQALQQSTESRKMAIGELDARLMDWRQSVPVQYLPYEHDENLNSYYAVHIVILHSFYLNSLTTVHRTLPTQLVDIGRPTTAVQVFCPQNYAANPSSIDAAREFMSLIRLTPRGNYAHVWLVLYAAASAVISLLHNVLHNPHHANAANDVDNVSLLIDILPEISWACEDTKILRDVQRMHVFSVELRRRALVAMNSH